MYNESAKSTITNVTIKNLRPKENIILSSYLESALHEKFRSTQMKAVSSFCFQFKAIQTEGPKNCNIHTTTCFSARRYHTTISITINILSKPVHINNAYVIL